MPYLKDNIIRRQIALPELSTFESGNPSVSTTFGIKNNYFFNTFNIEGDLYVRAVSSADKRTDLSTHYHYGGWSTLYLSTTLYFGSEQQYQLGLDLNNILNKRYTTAY